MSRKIVPKCKTCEYYHRTSTHMQGVLRVCRCLYAEVAIPRIYFYDNQTRPKWCPKRCVSHTPQEGKEKRFLKKVEQETLKVMASSILDLEAVLIKTGWTFVPSEHSEDKISSVITKYKEHAQKIVQRSQENG